MQLLAVGLAAVCALAAAACSGQQTEPADIRPLTSEPNSAGGLEPDHTDGSASLGGPAGSAEIGIDVIGYLFPATEEDASNVFPLGRLFRAVTHAATTECMEQAGFEYPPFRNEQFVPRFFDFPNLDTIAEIGFGMTHSIGVDPDMEVNPYDDLVPPELQEQFLLSLKRCYDQAKNPMRELYAAGGVLREQWLGQLLEIDSSPAILAQFEIWRQCMTDGGRPVRSHEDFFAELDGIVFGLLDDLAAARAEELSAARLYVVCMEPLEEVRQPLRDAARRQFLEDNSEEVRAIQELADRLIHEAQQQ